MASARYLLRKAAAFTRDLLPAQLTQLIFPAAALAFLGAAFGQWISLARVFPPENLMEFMKENPYLESLAAAGHYLFPIQYVFMAVAAFSLYVCFRAPETWKSIVKKWGLLPSVVGVLVFICWNFYVAFEMVQAASILAPPESRASEVLGKMPTLMKYWGPGFYCSLLGIGLIGAGMVLAAQGKMALPVCFRGQAEQTEEHLRIRKEIFWFGMFVILGPQLITLPFSVLINFAARFLESPAVEYAVLLSFVGLLIATAAPTIGALLCFSENRIGELKSLSKVGSWKTWLWAIGLPLGIGLGPWLLLPIVRDLLWHLPTVRERLPGSLVGVVGLPSGEAVILLFAALLEEIGWRGFLQPRAIHTFGLKRGIFVVSLLWAAFHFPPDMAASSGADVLLTLVWRFLTVGILSVVFAWLLLRSGSIWPVTLCHALWNITKDIELLPLRPQLPWVAFPEFILWGVASYILFRCFRPEGTASIPKESNAPT